MLSDLEREVMNKKFKKYINQKGKRCWIISDKRVKMEGNELKTFVYPYLAIVNVPKDKTDWDIEKYLTLKLGFNVFLGSTIYKNMVIDKEEAYDKGDLFYLINSVNIKEWNGLRNKRNNNKNG